MKKGQEEIVGFVLIIVIMAVVLLVFLGITIRSNDTNVKESKDIYQFLESISEFTSDCQIRSTEYGALGDLFEKCLNQEDCINELDSCEVLNITLSGLINSGWNIGPESNIKGYRFESFYEGVEEDSSGVGYEKIMSLEDGECNSGMRGASYLIPAFPGKIVNLFKLCL